ncbi:MAG: PE family protein [Mycobacteriaceae bacterium]|nr:PE family protein [Mycobacteriaceae bacterium]
MPFANVLPVAVAEAAGNMASIGSTLSETNAVAALSTVTVQAPGADEISVAIATLLGSHARQYQTAGAQAAEFHGQFVNLLNSSAGAYAVTEAANVQQILMHGASAASRALPGQALMQTGAAGAAASATVAPAGTEYLIPTLIILFTSALYDAVKAAVQILVTAVQDIIATTVYYLQQIVAYLQTLI